MCTAFSIHAQDHYFGRTLDLSCSCGQQICFTPRNFPLPFRRTEDLPRHHAIIGMAVVTDGYPLYFDAVNEQGLAMAGLNFPGNAFYHPEAPGKDNVTPFEFIPWLLGKCASLMEARDTLANLSLMDLPYSDAIPLSPIHWMVSDKTGSLVVESTREGIQVYGNPAGVMTNNPPFPFQLFQLNNYRMLSPQTPENTFSGKLPLEVYSQGLGGIGLPGDVSSMSRFVRGTYQAQNAVFPQEEAGCVSQFFHLLSSVEMTMGTCLTEDNQWDYTVYASCAHTPSGRYYYTTYGNHQICCVDPSREDPEGNRLSLFPLEEGERFHYQN